MIDAARREGIDPGNPDFPAARLDCRWYGGGTEILPPARASATRISVIEAA
jgi:hypothetical protein